ncbi:MAG: NADH-quinone oxidoreductase subunit A [Chloroflexi bacterium]|nr:MAG: NADH-quinone oxidoreductase subunit A [Chloroflexota bacterium]
MPSDYVPILIYLLVATFIAAFALVLPHYLGPRRPNPAKSDTIESGKLSYGDARRRVPVQYYIVAMVFILFDIEVLFFYPWAVLFWDLKWYGLVQIAIFAFLLVESYIYIWKKGAFKWK